MDESKRSTLQPTRAAIKHLYARAYSKTEIADALGVSESLIRKFSDDAARSSYRQGLIDNARLKLSSGESPQGVAVYLYVRGLPLDTICKVVGLGKDVTWKLCKGAKNERNNYRRRQGSKVRRHLRSGVLETRVAATRL